MYDRAFLTDSNQVTDKCVLQIIEVMINSQIH